MSEISTRATLVAKFAELTSALAALKAGASQARIDEGVARESMQEAWRINGQYSDMGRSAELAMFAMLSARQEAEAAESANIAMQRDVLDKLTALPSGKVWVEAETKASALLNHLQLAGGEEFSTALVAVQSLRSSITASITPEQLVNVCAVHLETIESAAS